MRAKWERQLDGRSQRARLLAWNRRYTEMFTDRLDLLRVGIPADEIPQLFTRFFRAPTASGIQGTGIGLHLVKEIVAMHGGTIDVASIVGRESTFTVRRPKRLPLPASGVDDAPFRHEPAPDSGESRRRIGG